MTERSSLAATSCLFQQHPRGTRGSSSPTSCSSRAFDSTRGGIKGLAENRTTNPNLVQLLQPRYPAAAVGDLPLIPSQHHQQLFPSPQNQPHQTDPAGPRSLLGLGLCGCSATALGSARLAPLGGKGRHRGRQRTHLAPAVPSHTTASQLGLALASPGRHDVLMAQLTCSGPRAVVVPSVAPSEPGCAAPVPTSAGKRVSRVQTLRNTVNTDIGADAASDSVGNSGLSHS